MIRQPIISVLGHIDSGKTTFLDRIRSGNVAGKEYGGITQSIGCTEIPIEVIKELCLPLLKRMKIELKIPGLLFIDTPGHSAFISLRKRGGSLSDMAVLIIDIIQGIMPQTKESIEILKAYKTPFVIALNKIDLLPGWKSMNQCFIDNYNSNDKIVRNKLDEKIYEIMGQLSELKIYSDRYDRIDDFTKTFAIVPISSKTGEGISDLLILLAGLSQQFLKEKLEVKEENGKGTVLEVSETKGFGKTMDVILYDGIFKKGQKIAYVGDNGVEIGVIRNILKPNPLEDIRITRKFVNVDKVYPSTGVKLVIKNFKSVIPGTTVISFERDEKEIKNELEEMEKIEIETHENGVVIKADSIGGLEALYRILREEGVRIKYAGIGEITKSDVIEASNSEDIERVVIGFNVNASEIAEKIAKDENVKIITDKVIYSIQEEYVKFREEIKRKMVEEELLSITRPCKFIILPDFIFRQSNPLICGIEIIEGVLNVNSEVMNDVGEIIGRVKSIQDNRESLKYAEKGSQVAISIDNGILGRNVDKGEMLFTNINKRDYKILKKYEKFLSDSEKNVLREIVEIKNRRDPKWKFV